MTVSSPMLSESLSALASETSTSRLEQIAKLRAHGVAEIVSLPQLVVCGAQSTGKSSVMEGLTGIPFPRREGVITATIIPDSERSPESQKALRDFHRTLKDFDELPHMIEEAGLLMGVKPHCQDNNAKELVSDILSIKLAGPTGLHLTVVDLPGLTGLTTSSTPTEKAETARALVKKYMKSSRTIGLAVLPANADVELQDIIGICKEVDPLGERSLGIITKPDLMNQSAAKSVASLAKNEGRFKFRLGYYIVKNPSPDDAQRNPTPQQSEEAEEKFFSGPPWSDLGLDKSRVGIKALRSGLQGLLDRHMESELPKVRDEIREAIRGAEDQLRALGEKRQKPSQMRAFLTRHATSFSTLSEKAITGHYFEESNFFGPVQEQEVGCKRLRAELQRKNDSFALQMRQEGKKRVVLKEDVEGASLAQGLSDNCEDDAQIFVSEDQQKQWVNEVHARTRGLELSGMGNFTFMSELFRIQSSRWFMLAQDHLSKVHKDVTAFVATTIRHVAEDERTVRILLPLMESSLENRRTAAEDELQRLKKDEEAPPMTYNSSFPEHVSHAQNASWSDLIREIENHASTESNVEAFVRSITASVRERLTDKDGDDALQRLDAYYELALRMFVDNVSRQVIERHLVRGLPKIFSADTVVAMTDDELRRYGGEEPQSALKRQDLGEKVGTLKKGLSDLGQF